jgi:hypothetical protein
MITEKDLHDFFKALTKHIKYFEVNYPDNPNLDKLKRLLSDNVSEDGKIHPKSSLLNLKKAFLALTNPFISISQKTI